ncbi:type 4a pilus biogenesis protein PilO [Cryptosporangium minutisporangium]|uniref:Type 4a pilus biogenesis protein PilO n=1 Tax=Cryptosporangium minutisporangium TaxID=113569 RepID=A0ABP6STG4_9ACTN
MVLSQLSSRAPSGLFDAAALRGNTVRLWVAGGVVGALLLIALGGFLLIRPQNARTEELRAQTETAQASVDSLRSRLAEVRSQNSRLAEYRSEYEAARAALPTTLALSTFLRDVQSSATRAGVAVEGLIVGAPTQVNGAAGATVYALPLTITATGSASKLEGFVNQLQRVQPRAVLVSTTNAVPNESSNSLRGSVLLTLGMRAFVAPTVAGSALTTSTQTTD